MPTSKDFIDALVEQMNPDTRERCQTPEQVVALLLQKMLTHGPTTDEFVAAFDELCDVAPALHEEAREDRDRADEEAAAATRDHERLERFYV